jgi:DNA-binding NtrC family response regulator
MNTPWQILVVSSDLESRRALMQVLTRLGLDPISASNASEAKETLQQDKAGLVFCDRHLADGSYREILNIARSSPDKVRVVVTSKHADWDEYLEAMRLGALDVIAWPCRATDVEWMVIQAKRDERTRSKELLSIGGDQAPLTRASAGSTA